MILTINVPSLMESLLCIYGTRSNSLSTNEIIDKKVCMNLVSGLSTRFRNFSMQTIDDLSFYFHEGFHLLFQLIMKFSFQTIGYRSETAKHFPLKDWP